MLHAKKDLILFIYRPAIANLVYVTMPRLKIPVFRWVIIGYPAYTHCIIWTLSIILHAGFARRQSLYALINIKATQRMQYGPMS